MGKNVRIPEFANSNGHFNSFNKSNFNSKCLLTQIGFKLSFNSVVLKSKTPNRPLISDHSPTNAHDNTVMIFICYRQVSKTNLLELIRQS